MIKHACSKEEHRSDIIIEKAKGEDKPAIFRLLKQANMHNIPSQEIPELTYENYAVAKTDGKVVGFCGYKILSKTEAKTELLVVDSEYRRRGIGYKLQMHRMKDIFKRGVETLITNSDIPATIAWYKKHFGYKEIGKLKKFHDFSHPDIDHWTTLKVNLLKWDMERKKKERMNIIYDLGIPHPITPYPKLIINAAITGMVPTKQNTPYVPVSVEEIIQDAVTCCKAGASIVHIHARDEQGKPTYRKEIYAEIIKGIRERCPDLIICASTSGRRHNTFEKRSQVLELEGDAKPDMGSLTMGSINFPTEASINTPEMIQNLALKMKNNGIVPEIEIFESGMINTTKILIKKGILEEPFYFNLLLGSLYSASGTLFDLACMVQNLPANVHWGAAGIGKFQLKMNFASVLMGGNVRVGLEDNIYYDNGKERLATNTELIQRVVRFAKEIGREVATPNEAREILGISPHTLEVTSS